MKTFSLRSLCVFVAITALACGWAVDHHHLSRELDVQRKRGNLSDASWEVRRARIAEVAKQDVPDVPLLLYALSDPDWEVRDTALAALQEIPVTEYVPGDVTPQKAQVMTEFERWLRSKAD